VVRLLIFSDIHGDKAALEKLMAIEADYYFAAGDLANFGRGLDAMGPVMPGNHETEADIARFCREYGFHEFHGREMEIAGYHVAGLGYSNLTPFKTPGEYTEQELQERLQKFSGLNPLVLICHTPPKGAALDRAGEGQHFGSEAVREFIHEAAGQHAVLGRTQGWNVGKRGQLLELPPLVK
jgi:Icc-related predicted phosphoesterase